MKKLAFGIVMGIGAASASAQEYRFNKSAYFQAPAGASIIKQTTDSIEADGRDACLQRYAGCAFTGYELVKLETFHQQNPAIIATFVFRYSVN